MDDRMLFRPWGIVDSAFWARKRSRTPRLPQARLNETPPQSEAPAVVVTTVSAEAAGATGRHIGP